MSVTDTATKEGPVAPTKTACEKCGTTEKLLSEVRFPDHHVEMWCTDCWNASVTARQEERKVELAARPKCEACQKRPGTWHVGTDHVLMCGWCKKRASQNSPRVSMLYAGMLAPGTYGRDAILAAARKAV